MLFGGLARKIISLMLFGRCSLFTLLFLFFKTNLWPHDFYLSLSSLKKYYLTVLFRSALGKVNLGVALGNQYNLDIFFSIKVNSTLKLLFLGGVLNPTQGLTRCMMELTCFSN